MKQNLEQRSDWTALKQCRQPIFALVILIAFSHLVFIAVVSLLMLIGEKSNILICNSNLKQLANDLNFFSNDKAKTILELFLAKPFLNQETKSPYMRSAYD